MKFVVGLIGTLIVASIAGWIIGDPIGAILAGAGIGLIGSWLIAKWQETDKEDY